MHFFSMESERNYIRNPSYETWRTKVMLGGESPRIYPPGMCSTTDVLESLLKVILTFIPLANETLLSRS